MLPSIAFTMLQAPWPEHEVLTTINLNGSETCGPYNQHLCCG